jgi:hypothetical protein
MKTSTARAAASRARGYYTAGVRGRLELARAAQAAAQSEAERAEWATVIAALEAQVAQ